MQRIYHRAIMTIIFLVAITAFTINIVNLMFIQGLIVFLTFLVGINIYGIATQSITVKSISIMIAISLLFIGVAVFGHFGVEQRAIGYETLYDFSANGIAAALSILFLSSFFFAISISMDENPKEKAIKPLLRAQSSKVKISKKQEKETYPEGWEEASFEDIESGKYTY